MLKQYSIAVARNRPPVIVHDVEVGPAVVLTRRGKPVVVLLSIDEYKMRRDRPDFFEALSSDINAGDPIVVGPDSSHAMLSKVLYSPKHRR